MLSYLIVRVSHNQAEMSLRVRTDQKLRSEASIIICRLQEHFADRSWYDECQDANHAYYL